MKIVAKLIYLVYFNMSSCPNCPKNSATKFSDFAKITNDFFGKEFPAGQVRFEVKSTAKPSTGAKVSFTDVRAILN